MLVLTQVVLSAQLPFAMYPLIRMTSDRRAMGSLHSAAWTTLLAWALFAVIVAANLWLMVQLFVG
jgi:manganese transport protein